MQKLLNAVAFAYELGRTKRLTLEASAPFHRAYVKGDEAAQAALRTDWCVGYIRGFRKVSEERAAEIWAGGKGKSAIDVGAVNAARTSFAHHVVRDAAANAKREGAKPVRLPSGCVDRIKAAYAGLTRAQIIEAHKRALDSIVFK